MSGPAIKAFRERKGWSQQRLAEELGVDQATVSRMENGGRPSRSVSRLLDRLIAECEAPREAAE